MDTHIENQATKAQHPKKDKSLSSIVSFAIANLGGSALYMTFGTYFMIYVTTAMFTGVPAATANKLIAMITSLVFIIRIAEIFVDPILGNIVDNTNTKWGKFKPWLIIGGTISALLLIVLFSGVFGLSRMNPLWFTILFIPIFIIFDVFYSFRDVSYWGMVPALTEDSHERSIYTAAGNFTGFGQNIVTMIVVPVVTYFTFVFTGKHNEGQAGWTVFAAMIAVVAIICSFVVALGTHEKNNAIRQVTKKKTSLKEMFYGLAHNDQMLWTALPYLVYGFGNAATAGLMFYMFKYVLGQPGAFWISGIIPTIAGFFTSPLFPIINKYVPRKIIYCVSMISMILAYVIFIVSTDSLPMVIFGLVLYYVPQGFIFMTIILTLTDTIEYGQLKNGNRNEAVTLAIRPMLDKMSGALSNAIVGWVAVATGMTGTATAASITPAGIHLFKGVAFYAGLVLLILALVIYMAKVKVTEKKHAEIVEELQAKLASEGIEGDSSETVETNQSVTEFLTSPVEGVVQKLDEVEDETGHTGVPGNGFAVRPLDGHIYAPANGKIILSFTTKQTIGFVMDQGLELLIHVGLGTVNMRGEGFITHFVEGQQVKKGDLLLDFNRDLIKSRGYKDTVLILFTEQKKIDQENIEVGSGETVDVDHQVAKISFKR